jgi:hypothetical protein
MKLMFTCVECSQKLNIAHSQMGSVVTCPACGAVQAVTAPLAKRFRGLRITASVLQVLAVIVPIALITIVLLAVGQSDGGHTVLDNILLLGVGIFSSLLSGLLIYALGEGIWLLINLEENTRATRQLLALTRCERKSTPPSTPS